ncbi:MAG: PIN domain nuclease [Deltaproteobacteria bacterium]|nr:PIN domain nuclease [Deltaproteobacteria bacterium]
MILVDTSVWIDFLNGAESKERHTLHRLIEQEEEISITGIILTKILQGIKEDKNFHRVKGVLMEFSILQPKGAETYLKAAGIFRDCIIAAICIENNLRPLHASFFPIPLPPSQREGG